MAALQSDVMPRDEHHFEESPSDALTFEAIGIALKNETHWFCASSCSRDGGLQSAAALKHDTCCGACRLRGHAQALLLLSLNSIAEALCSAAPSVMAHKLSDAACASRMLAHTSLHGRPSLANRRVTRRPLPPNMPNADVRAADAQACTRKLQMAMQIIDMHRSIMVIGSSQQDMPFRRTSFRNRESLVCAQSNRR